jgi:hypothetical protein
VKRTLAKQGKRRQPGRDRTFDPYVEEQRSSTCRSAHVNPNLSLLAPQNAVSYCSQTVSSLDS